MASRGGSGGAGSRRGGADGGRTGDGDLWRGAGVGGVVEVFADAAEAGAKPEERSLRGVDEGEDGLAGGGGDEFAELDAGELEECGRFFGAAETLEYGEGRKEGGLRRGAQVELDLQRDGVARSGVDEIGRQEQAEHRNTVWRGADEARPKATSCLVTAIVRRF